LYLLIWAVLTGYYAGHFITTALKLVLDVAMPSAGLQNISLEKASKTYLFMKGFIPALLFSCLKTPPMALILLCPSVLRHILGVSFLNLYYLLTGIK
jgi:hypothetical protein